MASATWCTDGPASSRGVVWRQQHGAQMVRFVSQPSIAVCTLWVNIMLPKADLFSVLQGSVLGLILFLLYTADLISLVETHGLSLLLSLGRGTAFRSRLRHQRPFRFYRSCERQFYLLAPSCSSNTFLRVILSHSFILQFYVFFYCAF